MIEQVKKYISTNIGRIPFLFALMYAMKVLGFAPDFMEVIGYGLLIVAAIYILSHGVKLDGLLIVLLLFIPLTIVLANPNPVFRPWMRYGLFFLLLIVVSPLIKSAFAKRFRLKIMGGTLLLCVLIASLSFLGFFLGINYMRNQYDGSELDYITNTAGTFGGLTYQSMLLGPLSGIGVVTCTYYALTRIQYKRHFIVLSIMCTGAMLFAASRSALIATICGEMALFYFFSTNKSVFAKRIVGILILGAITYPIWNRAFDGITAKNVGSFEQGINTDSRSVKWAIRLKEFSESPIWGIGFAAVSDRDDYREETGVIEPGSSWLAVLSMTGIVGFIIFFAIYIRACRRALLSYTPQGALLGGVLVLVGVHMIAEGHIFSGGSYLCFLVWLAIGVCTDYNSQKKY